MVNRSPTERRWLPTSQPQTLQIGVWLLYWNALLGLVAGLVAGGVGRLGLLVVAAEIAGGYGISNERKWGYWIAVAAAVVPLILLIAGGGAASVLLLLFQVALVLLLLHPMSRAYYKTWFR